MNRNETITIEDNEENPMQSSTQHSPPRTSSSHVPKMDEIDFNTEYSALMLAGKALCLAGDRKRYAQRRELLSLRANKFIPVNKNLKQQQESCDLEFYRCIVQQVFGYSGDGTDANGNTDNGEEEKKTLNGEVARNVANKLEHHIPHTDAEEKEDKVLKLQTKLCHALHWHEIQVKQIHLYKRHHKLLVKEVLKKQLKDLQDEIKAKELKTEIRRVQEETQQALEECNAKIQKQLNQKSALKCILEKHSSISLASTPEVSQHSKHDNTLCLSPRPTVYSIDLPDEEIIGTPPILRSSKIWNDLKEADERDATKVWNVRKKCGLGLSSHGSSHITRHRTTDLGLSSHGGGAGSSSHHSPTKLGTASSHNPRTPTKPPNSSVNNATNSTTPEGSGMFSSILGNIGWAAGGGPTAASQNTNNDSFDNISTDSFGNIEEDSDETDGSDDEFACDDAQETTTTTMTAASVTKQVTDFFSMTLLEEMNFEELSPTQLALRELTEEVFASGVENRPTLPNL